MTATSTPPSLLCLPSMWFWHSSFTLHGMRDRTNIEKENRIKQDNTNYRERWKHTQHSVLLIPETEHHNGVTPSLSLSLCVCLIFSWMSQPITEKMHDSSSHGGGRLWSGWRLCQKALDVNLCFCVGLIEDRREDTLFSWKFIAPAVSYSDPFQSVPYESNSESTDFKPL